MVAIIPDPSSTHLLTDLTNSKVQSHRHHQLTTTTHRAALTPQDLLEPPVGTPTRARARQSLEVLLPPALIAALYANTITPDSEPANPGEPRKYKKLWYPSIHPRLWLVVATRKHVALVE
jgi:hypothetical protein